MSIVILFGLYLASNNGQYGVSNAVRLASADSGSRILKLRFQVVQIIVSARYICLHDISLMHCCSLVIVLILYLTQGITFNLIITSVDRRENGQESEASHRHHERNQPLHMISIKTTVSRFPDPASGGGRGTTPESLDTKATEIANKWEEGEK